ncbi:LysR family transcriptional regulator [Massilia sp. ZL223]|uniref:LysR family transcriptional regulator n=1 Tax=Massilia sp. ZL223 TaxID=2824904 RepID=UPI001B81CB01|nr:LysR family transcriptional regulator [Massilia sp. ZL223]MBQ5961601.1 LysR family transcriptional regulator [Massilia sp. ZL223]
MASIRNFKTFLAVARHGSFAAAGKEIGLTAAAVGLQMRALEEELDQVLFDRGPRSVVLNTAGRKAVPQIEDLLARFEALAGSDSHDELSGRVVMGALVSALMGSFADALWTIKRQHPALKVQLFGGLSADFVVQVERGELDAAIVTQPPRALASSLVWTPLYHEPMVLIVPRRPHFDLPDKPLDVLREAPFIRFDRHTWTGSLVKDVLDECGVGAREELELNSVEAIIEIVRQGFGVSIVPQLANVRWEQDEGLRVVRLRGVTVERCVGMVERTRHSRMAFTAAIKEYFADRPVRAGQA